MAEALICSNCNYAKPIYGFTPAQVHNGEKAICRKCEITSNKNSVMSDEKVCTNGHVMKQNEEKCPRCNASAPVNSDNEEIMSEETNNEVENTEEATPATEEATTPEENTPEVEAEVEAEAETPAEEGEGEDAPAEGEETPEAEAEEGEEGDSEQA